eukprot:scaffold134546_cov18-Tisochrysis_lutea.AAC.1
MRERAGGFQPAFGVMGIKPFRPGRCRNIHNHNVVSREVPMDTQQQGFCFEHAHVYIPTCKAHALACKAPLRALPLG